MKHSILITGASAGIGAALARYYAQLHGPSLLLGLVARREDRLAELAAEVEALGARAAVYPADVRDAERMSEVCRRFEEAGGGVGLAVANAGISRSDDLERGDPGTAWELFAINVQGVLNTLLPLVPAMISRGHGHLAAIGSVAGFRGLPGKGAYCASKSAVKTLLDAYRPALKPHGIRVTTICPGWVESELSASNPYPMPFLMDAPKAARLIARAIQRGRRTYIFPWQMRLAIALLRAAPEWALPTHGLRK